MTAARAAALVPVLLVVALLVADGGVPGPPGPAASGLRSTLGSADGAGGIGGCRTLHPAMVYPLRVRELEANLRCAYGLGHPLAASSAIAPGPTGAARGGPPAFGLYNQQMTYDASDGYLLLFGATGSGPLNGTETWEFTGGHWTRLYPSTSPESCLGSVMAYDSFDGYVLYLAGGNLTATQNCTSAGETWTYHAGSWTELHPAVAPPPRQAAAMTNDSRDGYMLLFGGACSVGTTVGLCGDTWSFLNGNWTNRTGPNGPSPRAGAGMTYDASDGYVLMFGGIYWPPYLLFPYMLSDTWKYVAGKWTQIAECGGYNQYRCQSNQPPNPWPDGMTYDAADGVVLYVCARENISSGPENFYTFHAGKWTNLNQGWSLVGVPPDRVAEALAYDWGDGYAVLFGGISVGWVPLNDTWTFLYDHWTNVTARFPTGPAPVRFTESGLPRGTAWTLNLTYPNGTTTSTTTNGSRISFVLARGSYRYLVTTISGYATRANASFPIVGLERDIVLAFVPVKYTVAFTETGLAKGHNWQVTFDGRTVSSKGSAIDFAVGNGSYGFLVSAPGLTCTPSSGTVTVAGASVSVAITVR